MDKSERKDWIAQSTCWVVKIGSSLLGGEDGRINLPMIETLAGQITRLREQGVDCLLVSSGAVRTGMRQLGWSDRPQDLPGLQAAAAIGQAQLSRAYESAFGDAGLATAQVLLTHADLANRVRYLNARATLRVLRREGVIAVINENDTIANEEIRFGDNDTLAAMVSNLVEADLMVLLTDQPGLYAADPRHDPKARLIPSGAADDPELLAGAGPAAVGSGGMYTKVLAARKAARAGAATLILDGRAPDALLQVRAGGDEGTWLWPGHNRLAARKQWLAGQLRAAGRLILDDGAVHVLRDEGRSLLPVGVVAVDGEFGRGDLVVCVDQNQTEVARGLVNYSSAEAARIAGQSSGAIEQQLGYMREAELIHRDNLVLS